MRDGASCLAISDILTPLASGVATAPSTKQKHIYIRKTSFRLSTMDFQYIHMEKQRSSRKVFRSLERYSKGQILHLNPLVGFLSQGKNNQQTGVHDLQF